MTHLEWNQWSNFIFMAACKHKYYTYVYIFLYCIHHVMLESSCKETIYESKSMNWNSEIWRVHAKIPWVNFFRKVWVSHSNQNLFWLIVLCQCDLWLWVQVILGLAIGLWVYLSYNLLDPATRKNPYNLLEVDCNARL